MAINARHRQGPTVANPGHLPDPALYSGEPLCRAGITHVIHHQGEADGSGEGSELLENVSMEEMLPNGTPSGLGQQAQPGSQHQHWQ